MFWSHLAAFLFARRLLRGQNVGAKPLISGTLQYYSKTLHHQLSLQILSYPHPTSCIEECTRAFIEGSLDVNLGSLI